jgi:hypothetical protein
MYGNKKNLYRLMGGDFSTNITQTLDEFLSKIDPTSNGALLVNEWKKNGVSGDTTIQKLLGSREFYEIIKKSIRVVNSLLGVESHNLTSNEYNDYVDPKLEGVGDGDSITEYKLAKLPKPSYVTQSIPRPDLVGEAFDTESWIVGNRPFIKLSNDELAEIYYCQAVLPNGVFIYEAYTLEEGISGYWVAFEQDPNDPTLLNKVADIKMTEQFWDYWYNWTVKDGAANEVKLVNAPFDIGNETQLYSSITKLTYLNGELTVEDTLFDFDGETAASLYETFSGESEVANQWSLKQPEYILDDDYYGMAIGSQAGWYYYRNTSFDGFGVAAWNCVGFNILTGEVRWLTPGSDFIDNVTNFDFSGYEDIEMFSFVDWFNHPNGIAFSVANGKSDGILNGNNVDNVTAVWSPYWQNPNQIIYLNSRYLETGEFLLTRGNLLSDVASNFTWYWDNENIYLWHWGERSGMYYLIVDKYNTNTKEFTTWNIPVFEYGGSSWWSWANNNGLLLNYPPEDYSIFGQLRYYYFSNSDNYLTLQSNNWYPTNIFGNQTFTTNSILNNNIYRVGVQIDEYKGVQF